MSHVGWENSLIRGDMNVIIPNAVFGEKEERAYRTFRVAIASGLFASLGVTLAWILWLAWKAFNVELGTTIVVGALVGFIVHWCRNYLHTANYECAHPASKETAGPHGGSRSMTALIWATGFAFLGLASEHLVADMAARYLQPILGSLVTLLPAGMIFGISMHLGSSKSKGLLDVIFFGLVSGALVALVTGLLWSVGWGNAPWLPLFSWWCLVGVGMRFFTPAERDSTRFDHPVRGIVAAFVLMVLLSLLPDHSVIYRIGPVRNAATLAKMMAITVINAPGMPAEFWLDAEKHVGESRKDLPPAPSHGAQAPRVAPSTGLRSTPRAAAKDEAVQTLSAEVRDRPAAQRSGVRFTPPARWQSTAPDGRSSSASSQPASDPNHLNRELEEMNSLRRAIPSPGKPATLPSTSTATPTDEPSWPQIGAELNKEFDSPLVRSWFVLLLFGVGLGLSPRIERRLCPPDYPSSATFRKDVTIAVFLLVAIAIACVYSRAIR